MKAQLKMTESTFILIIFFFLLVFGLVFYMRWTKYENQALGEQINDLIAQKVAQKVQFLPELQCTTEGDIKYNCIDIMKLESMKNIPDKQKRIYDKMFPDTKITLYQVYPTEKSWEVYGDVPESNSRVFLVPVAIFDPATDQNTMGYMNISVHFR